MTREEISELFGLISVLFPNDKAFVSASAAMLSAWHAMLADLPFELAQAALQRHAAANRFAPSIAEIREFACKLSGGQALTADEAYGFARRAIAKYGYNRREAAQRSMPPEVWQLVERMGYRDLCMSENIGVMRSNFLRMWEAFEKRQNEDALLPPALRERLGAAAAPLRLE